MARANFFFVASLLSNMESNRSNSQIGNNQQRLRKEICVRVIEIICLSSKCGYKYRWRKDCGLRISRSWNFIGWGWGVPCGMKGNIISICTYVFFEKKYIYICIPCLDLVSTTYCGRRLSVYTYVFFFYNTCRTVQNTYSLLQRVQDASNIPN